MYENSEWPFQLKFPKKFPEKCPAKFPEEFRRNFQRLSKKFLGKWSFRAFVEMCKIVLELARNVMFKTSLCFFYSWPPDIPVS